MAFPSVVFAMGSANPTPPSTTPPSNGGGVTPAPSVPVTSGMAANAFVAATNVKFTASPVSGLNVKPACLKAAGVDLIILDPGHDDSSDSTRSDAKIRGGNGKYVIQWPKVHEGKLNMVSAWLAYDALMKNPNLSAAERDELQTMIRFSRMPGEKTFGTYEKSAGYAASTSGTIDAGVTNRAARIRYMMQNHRKYDASKASKWSASVSDVSSRTVMLSVHANSSEYYDEGDLTWVIPPKSTSQSSKTFALLRGIASGFADQLGDYFEVDADDSSTESALKRGVASTAREERIKKDEHSVNLAVLSSSLGNSSTRKLLLEGFVMNGKAGHLANIDLTGGKAMKLEFRRSGTLVQSYDVADLYLAYGRSIAQGIETAFGCQ